MFHGENCCNEEGFVSEFRDDDNGEGGEESVNKVVVRDGGASFGEALSGGESLVQVEDQDENYPFHVDCLVDYVRV